MPIPDSNDGWDQWSRYVLEELKRLNKCYESMREDLLKVHTEVVVLRGRAGIWGAVGATIPVIGMLLWQLLK